MSFGVLTDFFHVGARFGFEMISRWSDNRGRAESASLHTEEREEEMEKRKKKKRRKGEAKEEEGR